MRRIVYSSFPGKNIKRKIVNKIKFSQKMSNHFFGSIHEYNLEMEKISPILYYDKKIALNIVGNVKENDIKKIVNNLNFPFDIFSKQKIQNNNKLYTNKFYNFNILNDIGRLFEYDIVISIDSTSLDFDINYGFFESCISLLANGKTEFIQLNNDYYSYKIFSWEYKEFILDNTRIEMLFDDKYVKMSKACIFSPKNLHNVKKEKINEIEYYLLLKSIMLESNNVVLFNSKYSFAYCQNKIVDKIELYSNTKNKLFNQVKNYDTVTFDIFDTLITRKFLNPDDIFYFIDKKNTFNFGKEFISVRKQAEINARNKLKKDVNIYEIYNEILSEYKISKEQLNEIMNMEIKMEIDNIIPRTDMLEIYNMLLKKDVNIDLISDMYLPKEIIEKLLSKCNIHGYRNLLISCDQNLRKDNKEMWKKYFLDNKENTIHIGDNYFSDYLYVLQEGRPAIKILSSLEFINYDLFYNYNFSNSVDLGLLFNARLFNSPFFNKTNVEKTISLYGKYFLAPIFLTFFNWLEKRKDLDELLFISREGYYLQKIYKEFCQLYNMKELNNHYFLASRRAVSFPSCNNLSDLDELLSMEYKGLLSEFFKKRFSYDIKINQKDDHMIILPDDKDTVREYLNMHKDKLLYLSKKELKEYLSYIDRNFKFIYEKNCAIIDLGYSGTTQYYLSKIINKQIDGYYFAITKNKKPEKLGCKIMGCFNEKNNKIDDNNSFYRKSLLLESFLSAPEGQLINFKNGKPCFTDSTFNKEKSKYLDKIYDGVIDGLVELKEKGIDNFEVESINIFYDFTCKFLTNVKYELKNVLYIDDDFCTDGKKIRKIL